MDKYKNRLVWIFICMGIIIFLVGVISLNLKTKRDINNVDAYKNISSVSVFINSKSLNKKVEETTSSIVDDELAAIIRKSFKKKITFDINVYPKLSRQALQIAYDRKLILEGRGKDYSLIIKGEDIQDYNKELDMAMDIKSTKTGYILSRKDKGELPGKVIVKIRNKKYFKNNLYLYNKIKGKYELLQKSDFEWEIDREGKYLLTNKDLYEFKVNYRLLLYVSIGLLVMIIIYILVRKKYLFWWNFVSFNY